MALAEVAGNDKPSDGDADILSVNDQPGDHIPGEIKQSATLGVSLTAKPSIS